MTQMVRLCCWREWLYRIHVLTGLIAALWLLLVAITGVLINHQESLGLLDMELSDRYLPAYYRSDLRTGSVRLNILITDLHSGRILGAKGHWVGDGIALLLVISLTSGAFSYWARRRLRQWNHNGTPAVREASPPPGVERLPKDVEVLAGNSSNGRRSQQVTKAREKQNARD